MGVDTNSPWYIRYKVKEGYKKFRVPYDMSKYKKSTKGKKAQLIKRLASRLRMRVSMVLLA